MTWSSKGSDWTPEDIEKKKRENPDLARVNPDVLITILGEKKVERDGRIPQSAPGPGGNKYHVADKEDRTYNGRIYHSKKEASFAAELDLRVKAGEIDFYLEQVPFRLPGGIVYCLDFMTVAEDDAIVNHYYEVKGFKVRLGEMKRKQTIALYKIHIEVV